MEEKNKTTLKEVCSNIDYGYTASADFSISSPKFLRITDIQGGFIDWRDVPGCKISEEERKRNALKKGDVVIARTGNSTGENAYIDRDVDAVFASFLVRYQPDAEVIVPEFLKYVLRDKKWFAFVKSIADAKSAQPGANATEMGRYTFALPSKSTQQKIAKILGDLDRKIELNRRMNETLEQIGQTLFKKYFVDNPESNNWQHRTLGEFFPVRTGKKDANFSTPDGEYPFFTCSQSTLRAPNYSFDGDALLLAGNGDFNLKYYRGKFEAYQRTYVLIPKNKNLVGILYFLMSNFLADITGGSRGSVIKFITKGMIENYKIYLPSDDLLAEQAKVFSQLTVNIEKNKEEVNTLSKVRDILLPKLISGEIEV